MLYMKNVYFKKEGQTLIVNKIFPEFWQKYKSHSYGENENLPKLQARAN